MPPVPGKKKAAEPRQENQNSIILNETNTSSGLTRQMQNVTIDDFDFIFEFPHIQPSSTLIKKKTTHMR